jgi:hypothetical protein
VRLEGTAITDGAESMAAAQRNIGTPLLAFKTAQALALGDWSRFVVQGVPLSITSLVADAASNGSRILVVGTGGNRCTFTSDDGASWTAGGALASSASRVVWNAFAGFFLVNHATSAVSRSTNGVAWSLDGASAIDPVPGLAVLSNGVTVGLSSATPGTIRRAPAGGITYSSVGSMPNVGTLDENGSVAGNNGATIYHVGRHSSGAELQVSSSVDGTTWSVIATLAPPGSSSFSGAPRLLMCQNTGLLVVACPNTSAQTALYASLDGVDWVGPQVLFPALAINGFALAGGRLLATFDDMLFASDGVGY